MTVQPLPEIEPGLFRGKCPVCGRRFWNGMWQWTAYSMHYATAHLGIAVFQRPPHLRSQT